MDNAGFLEGALTTVLSVTVSVNASAVASSTEVCMLILLSQVGFNLIAGFVGAHGRRHPSDNGSQGRQRRKLGSSR